MGHVDLGVGETRPVGAGMLPSPLPVSTEPDGLPAPCPQLPSAVITVWPEKRQGNWWPWWDSLPGGLPSHPLWETGHPLRPPGATGSPGASSPPSPTSRCLPDVPSLVRCRLWVSPAMTCGLLAAPPQPCTPTEAASGSSTLDLRSRCSGGRQDHCAAQHTPGGPAPRAAPFYGVVFGIPAAQSSWGS